MVSLGNGVQNEMRQAFDSVGLETVRLYPVTEEDVTGFDPFGQRPRTKLLTPALLQQLAAREGVLEASPYLGLPGAMRATVMIDDQEVQASLRTLRPAAVPEPFQVPSRAVAGVDEPPEEGGGVVLADHLLLDLGYEEDDLPDLIGRQIDLVLYAPRSESQTFRFQVAGIVENLWGDVLLATPDRLAMLEWWYADPDYLARRGYDEIFIRTGSLSDAAALVEWLNGRGYEVESLKMILDMANRGMIILKTMLGSVGGLALLVASIGIANTMIMAVYERTKEIGILKAVGAAPGQIRLLFVVEASMIGLLGGVIGTLLGWLLGRGLNWLILRILEWQEMPMQGTFFVVAWWLVVAALTFATLVGLLAGLYPAARAARLQPLDALRYE
jgi:hypothetical protein